MIVFLKELLEALRDFRSLIPSMIVALAIGPIVTIITPRALEGEVKKVFFEKYTVGMTPADKEIWDELFPDMKHQEFGYKVIAPPALPDLKDASQGLDIVVHFDEPRVTGHVMGAEYTKAPVIEVANDNRKPQSQLAGLRLGGALSVQRELLADKLKAEAGIDVIRPTHFESGVLHGAAKWGTASPFLRASLPGILLFMAFLGTIYPALDAITGERQRGSLELLLVTRASRRSLFFGKLMAVTVCAYLPCFVALSSFYVCQFFQPPLAEILPLPFTAILPLDCFAWVALLILPICLTLACAALALSAFARSVQQGQGYFLPLMLITFLPAMLVTDGAVKLNAAVCMTPFLNCLALMNNILAGDVQPGYFILVVVSSVVFALGCAYVVAPVMEREELLFSLEESPHRRYVTGDFRREVFFLLTLDFVLMFYLSQALIIQAKLWGIIMTQLLVVFLPAFVLVKVWLRLPITKLEALKTPRVSGKPSFMVYIWAMGTSLFSVGISLAFLTIVNKLLPGAQALGEKMSKSIGLTDSLNTSAPQTIAFIIFALALMPALMEEFLFRGVVLGLLPRKYSTRLKVIVVGTLFGLFHMSTLRFFPTAALGCVLTYLRLSVGSIYPGILLHFCHNALTLSLSFLLQKQKAGAMPEWQMIAMMITIGTVCLLMLLRLKADSGPDRGIEQVD